VGRGSGAVGPGAALGRDRDRLREADRDSEREAASRQDRDRLLGREAAESERERERLIDRHRDRSQVGMGPGKSPRLAVAARRRRGREEELHLTLTPTERTFFARLKGVLGGREAWVEALKCFDLYSAGASRCGEGRALLNALRGAGSRVVRSCGGWQLGGQKGSGAGFNSTIANGAPSSRIVRLLAADCASVLHAAGLTSFDAP
jgi:hypothetical protein